MARKKKRSPIWQNKLIGLLIFACVFGGLGVAYLRFSSAANLEDPLGYADFCTLENNQTVIYGWAHDDSVTNSPGSLPNVTVSLSNGASTTVNTSISNYRESAIDNYLTSFGRPASNIYGFRAAFSGQYKGGNHTISGTIANTGPGVSQPLWINPNMHVDNVPANGFPNNVIPQACLANVPPPAPVVTVTISPGSVAYGGSTTVAWSATNNPTSCSNNFGGANRAPGSLLVTNLTASRTFTVTCSNAGGSGSANKTVTVAAKPPTPPPPGGGGGSSSGGGGSGGGVKRTPTTTPVANVAPDKEAPSVPGNVQAEFDGTAAKLSWDQSSDNTGVQAYIIERSTDNAAWEIMSDSSAETFYSDSTTVFNTLYYYRVKAKDQAGNESGYGSASITTGTFEPNLKPDQELVLTNEDETVKVVIPAGSVTQDAVCDLRSSNYLSPSLKNHSVIKGPYELLCKTADGTRITTSNQTVTVQLALNQDETKKYLSVKAFAYEAEWQEVAVANDSFELGNGTDFVIIGQNKTSPLWKKIVVAIVILLALATAVLLGLRFWYKRKALNAIKKKQSDYYNKERGY